MKRINLIEFIGIENLKNERKLKKIKKERKTAFTLAEIMIVLTTIGILTAILVPIAFNSAPDENVMKFKKGHNTLYTAIKDLVNSDQYYMNGDLGVRADGTVLDALTSEEFEVYFCNTFADIINTKYVNCQPGNPANSGAIDLRTAEPFGWEGSESPIEITEENLNKSKNLLDDLCKIALTDDVTGNGDITMSASVQIITTDNITFFEANPRSSFGLAAANHTRRFSSPHKIPADHPDENGFDAIYKVMCMDVDGAPEDITNDNCVNECPFGYGIRADGKILNGARADEWLQKSFQKGE